MYVQFIIIVTLLFVGSYMLLKKKLNIKEQTCLYGHINKVHKRGELLIVVVSILLLGILAFVENTPPLKSHYFVASLTALYGFRALMEWKFEKSSKRYILSILASTFLLVLFLGMELIFTNPVPINLNADQVKEISVILESGQEEINLTNNPIVYPILSALSDATYQIGRWPVTPSTEMTIKLKDSRKVKIGEFKSRTLSGSTSTVFIVKAERKLYPQDMIMYSPEMESIFDHLGE